MSFAAAPRTAVHRTFCAHHWRGNTWTRPSHNLNHPRQDELAWRCVPRLSVIPSAAAVSISQPTPAAQTRRGTLSLEAWIDSCANANTASTYVRCIKDLVDVKLSALRSAEGSDAALLALRSLIASARADTALTKAVFLRQLGASLQHHSTRLLPNVRADEDAMQDVKAMLAEVAAEEATYKHDKLCLLAATSQMHLGVYCAAFWDALPERSEGMLGTHATANAIAALCKLVQFHDGKPSAAVLGMLHALVLKHAGDFSLYDTYTIVLSARALWVPSDDLIPHAMLAQVEEAAPSMKWRMAARLLAGLQSLDLVPAGSSLRAALLGELASTELPSKSLWLIDLLEQLVGLGLGKEDAALQSVLQSLNGVVLGNISGKGIVRLVPLLAGLDLEGETREGVVAAIERTAGGLDATQLEAVSSALEMAGFEGEERVRVALQAAAISAMEEGVATNDAPVEGGNNTAADETVTVN